MHHLQSIKHTDLAKAYRCIHKCKIEWKITQNATGAQKIKEMQNLQYEVSKWKKLDYFFGLFCIIINLWSALPFYYL